MIGLQPLLGEFYHFANRAAATPDFAPGELMSAPDGSVQRHPTIWASPVAFAGQGGLRSDLIAGGDGTLYYYRFSGFATDGRAAFRPPVPVLEEHALIHAGTLPVVNAVDWDGDGVTDLVAGNSEGRIVFFRNRRARTHLSPDFALQRARLSAGGEEIRRPAGLLRLAGSG